MISRERLRQADKHALRRWWAFHPLGPWNNGLYGTILRDSPQMYRKVTVRCSGPCCGNPRRHFGQLTVQERRAIAADDSN